MPSNALTPQGPQVYVAVKQPSSGVLKLRARCDQTAAVTLTGTITAVIKPKQRRQPARSETFNITALRDTANAGKTLTMTVKFPQAALAALEAGVWESARFKLTATNARGTGATTAAVRRLKLVKT